MDPEYVITQELTEKSDIYSYGVLLLELVTGRRAIQDGKNIINWSQKFLLSDSKQHELVDPVIADSFDFEQLQVVVEVIQWCTHREGLVRPSIKQVLRMLLECLDPVNHGVAEAAWPQRTLRDVTCNPHGYADPRSHSRATPRSLAPAFLCEESLCELCEDNISTAAIARRGLSGHQPPVVQRWPPAFHRSNPPRRLLQLHIFHAPSSALLLPYINCIGGSVDFFSVVGTD
ncbi:putative receptor-like protein kinase [Platanthera zijinensis]|uniref:Receptor-like protein kinase n=1 Tax=Platanthera zijinensis TaxID=2320716 RepID=A0AAP0FXA8_9ASPA